MCLLVVDYFSRYIEISSLLHAEEVIAHKKVSSPDMGFRKL